MKNEKSFVYEQDEQTTIFLLVWLQIENINDALMIDHEVFLDFEEASARACIVLENEFDIDESDLENLYQIEDANSFQREVEYIIKEQREENVKALLLVEQEEYIPFKIDLQEALRNLEVGELGTLFAQVGYEEDIEDAADAIAGGVVTFPANLPERMFLEYLNENMGKVKLSKLEKAVRDVIEPVNAMERMLNELNTDQTVFVFAQEDDDIRSLGYLFSVLNDFQTGPPTYDVWYIYGYDKEAVWVAHCHDLKTTDRVYWEYVPQHLIDRMYNDHFAG